MSSQNSSQAVVERPLLSFCYFTNWSNKYSSFDARFQIRDINTTVCSHLIYAFANIDINRMELVQTQNDDDNGQSYNRKGRYYDFTALKMRAPHLVTLLSVGGAGSSKFEEVVRSTNAMRLFSRNCAVYLRDRDFDGLDIDWEYPNSTYRANFTQLLKIMRDEFTKESGVSKPALLITVTVSPFEAEMNNAYDIPTISSFVDYIHVQSYDFYGLMSSKTGFSSPLYPRQSDSSKERQLTVSWAIDSWIKMGAPANKIVMGLTGSAVTFTLANMTLAGAGTPVKSPGKAGPYLLQNGHVTYYEVCEMKRNGAVSLWDNEQKVPYAVLGNQWVGYDNEKSMREKVKFAIDRGIAGTSFWSMEMDDFNGSHCYDGKYPLLTAIYDATFEFSSNQSKPEKITGCPASQKSTPPDNSQKALLNFCYFNNWSNKRASFDARFDIRDINATLCSHIIYAFAGIDANTMKVIPTESDDMNGLTNNSTGQYNELAALKRHSPHLVTLLSVGGQTIIGRLEQVVRSNETMQLFSRNSATFLREEDFDGIDINLGLLDSTYKAKFTQLLQIMRYEFIMESKRVNKPALLITVSVNYTASNANKAYDIPALSCIVDYIHVQTYDFHGPWSQNTSFTSPLYPRQSDSWLDQQLTVSWAIDYWTKMGASASKIVMGMTGTALTYTLKNLTNTRVGAPVQTIGKAGPFLMESGHATYYRVCELVSHGAKTYFDSVQNMSYAVFEDQWIGYETAESLTEKVKFASDKRLAGVSFWSLDVDDFHGTYCNQGKFPLLTAIYNAIHHKQPAINTGNIIVG